MIVIAPAGAGIREVLLIAFLTPVIGSGPALAVALVLPGGQHHQRPAGGRRGRRDPPSRAQRHQRSTSEGKGQPPIPAETVTPVTSAPDTAS